MGTVRADFQRAKEIRARLDLGGKSREVEANQRPF